MRDFFGYIRVSTVKQGEHGVSLQEQHDAIAFYAQRNNLTITDWCEEKETAAKRGRPVFNRMLKLLRKGKAEGVIIHKIDRSARNLKDWADLGDLIDAGIKVHFTSENLDLNSRGGRLSADIQAVVAADYIRNLREETRKGFYGRLKQGLYPLPAPIGYLDMGKEKAKEPDPLRASLVRKAFELYSTGRYNLNSLAEEMHNLGLRNRNNKRVSKTGFSVMLNNPFYIGLIRLKSTRETFSGIHQPLITKSLFDRVQGILTGKTNTVNFHHDLLFRRLLTCKHCGYSLIGEIQKGRYVYYRCHTRTCPKTCVREEQIKEKVQESLEPLQFTEPEKAYLKSKIIQLQSDWEFRQEDHLKAIQLEISQLQERLNRLTDAYIDRMIEKEIFEQRKTSLLYEKKALEEKLTELQEKKVSLPDKLSEFLELAGSAWLSYESGILSEKQDLLKAVTSNRTVEAENVSIELKLPFNEVANRYNFQNGAPRQAKPRRRTKLPAKATLTKRHQLPLDRMIKRLVKYFGSNKDNLILTKEVMGVKDG